MTFIDQNLGVRTITLAKNFMTNNFVVANKNFCPRGGGENGDSPKKLILESLF